MFSYYGSKSKIVHLYPTPEYDDINEVFAGSARYSLRFWERNITIVDKYPVIVEVWKYLQQASEKDILSLPVIKKGEKINIHKLSNTENNFLGLIYAMGAAMPQSKGTSMATGRNPGRSKTRAGFMIGKTARDLHKIKHWEIICGDYRDLKNKDATWFVDPPYQFGGEHYKESSKNIDFKELGEWCKSRKGQTIVCENTKADWLPFKPMKLMQGTIHKTTEAIWSNLETAFDWQQLSLF